jgi:hypothetical protein
MPKYHARHRGRYFTIAKFESTCPATGKVIERGQTVLYDPVTKQAFHDDSQQANDQRAMQFSEAFHMADANY